MILIFVFQGSRVFPRLWGDASVWLGVWPRPTTDHSRQPSTHAHNEPKPHPQLSHSVEVLLQRQLWLEGILRGEPLSAFLSVCRFARSMTTRPDALTLHTPIDCLAAVIGSIKANTHTYIHLDTPCYTAVPRQLQFISPYQWDWLFSVRVYVWVCVSWRYSLSARLFCYLQIAQHYTDISLSKLSLPPSLNESGWMEMQNCLLYKV